MSQLLANVLNTAIIVLEIVILYVFADGLFEPRGSRCKKIIAFVLGAALDCLILFFLGTVPYVKYVSTLLIAFTLIICCYNAGIAKSLFPVVFCLHTSPLEITQ